MEEIKGKLRSFVIAGDDQDGCADPCKIKDRPNQLIECVSRDIVFVKEISAVNEEIHLTFDRMFNNRQEVIENGLGPSLASLQVTGGSFGELESKMGVCGMDEFQVTPSGSMIHGQRIVIKSSIHTPLISIHHLS